MGLDFCYSAYSLWLPRIGDSVLAPSGSSKWLYPAVVVSSITQDQVDVVFEDQGRQCNIDDLMRDEHLSGLIVLQDDQILLERYALGLTPQLRWQSSSMVKSLTSTLVGAALYDGLIGSLDDEITDYLPEFDNTSYQGVTLRHLLNMTSQGYLTAADSTCSVWTHQAL